MASARSSTAPGSVAAIWPRSARITRARISAAAFSVKVIARISPGSSTVHRRRRKRWVRTAVLPEPAGACSNTECEGSVACRRAAASASRLASLIGLVRGGGGLLRLMRADAAQRGQVAVVARPGGRIHLCGAGQELADEP